MKLKLTERDRTLLIPTFAAISSRAVSEIFPLIHYSLYSECQEWVSSDTDVNIVRQRKQCYTLCAFSSLLGCALLIAVENYEIFNFNNYKN